MSEQNNIYSNAVLSSTLDGMYRGLSGLYDVAVTHKAKIAQQVVAREAGDLALSAALSTAVKDITDSLTQSDSVVGELSTALSTAIDAQTSAREAGDTQTLSSAKKYTDDKLIGYYTSTQVDAISAAVEQAYKAADSSLSSAIDAINAKTIGGANAIAASTVDGATTISLNLNATSAILSQDASGLKTNISLQKITTGLADNIESEYALVGLNGVELGERIQVTKDRFLQDVKYIPSSQTLEFAFKTVSGTTAITDIDIGSLVDTYTAGNGITIENNVVTVKKDVTSEDFLKVTSGGVAVSGVSAAISSAVAPVDTRVKAIETAIPVSSVTSGAILVEKDGKIVLNNKYNPGIALQFNGKPVGDGITSLNFAGTTTITVDNGVAKVQIGENMNSSVWASKDGKQGDGSVSGFPASSAIYIADPLSGSATSASFKIGDWTSGTLYNYGSTTSKFTLGTSALIHLDENINTWDINVYGDTGTNIVASAQVNDTVTYMYDTKGAVSGATVVASAVSGSTAITHSITSGGLEINYPAAVGGRAIVSFTFDLSKIAALSGGGRYHVEIAGCGGVYISPERFYVAGAAPAIGSVGLIQKPDTSYTTTTYSGVKYITAGNFVVSAGTITNIWNQAAVDNALTTTGVKGLTNIGTNISPSILTNNDYSYNSVGSYVDDTVTLVGSYAASSVTVNFNIKNAKGNANGTAATIAGLNINTYTGTGTTDSIQTFVNEDRRLKESDLSEWDSTEVLGSTDLQVIPGSGLVYPTIDYSSIELPASNPDYSACSGTRYYVRKMSVSGNKTVFGGTLTFANNPTWADITFAKLSIDNGTTWFNLKAARGGADPLGIYNSYANGIVSFTFPGTTSMTASDGVIIKLGWSKTTTKITKITLAM